jgi:hypothetical protein
MRVQKSLVVRPREALGDREDFDLAWREMR